MITEQEAKELIVTIMLDANGSHEGHVRYANGQIRAVLCCLGIKDGDVLNDPLGDTPALCRALGIPFIRDKNGKINIIQWMDQTKNFSGSGRHVVWSQYL